MKKLGLSIVAVALLIVLMPFAAAAQGGYTVIQLTENEYDDSLPQIDAGQVVWRSHDGHDTEIFLWDDTGTHQLTDNNYDDTWPQIDAGMVVWYGYDGNNYEIFLWDDTGTHQLTDNDYPYQNTGPQIDAGQVVWGGYDGYDWEIFLWDGTQTIQLTNNNYHDGGPQIDAGQVAWIGYGDNYHWQTFLWDGTNIIQLSYDEYDDYFPQIDDGQVVWRGLDGNGGEIFLWDGTGTTRLTNNEYDDRNPQIDAGMVVWAGYTPYDHEIFLWEDGTGTTRLTDNNYYDDYPQIDDGMVVWQGGSGIFLWDGTDIIQLSYDVAMYQPQIDDGIVVWYGYDGHGHDSEIFLGVPVFPLDIQLNQVQIFPHGAEKVKIEGEFTLDACSEGIDPAVDGFNLQLSLEESSQFYPDPSNDFMPVKLQETIGGWTISQSEKDRTGIQDLEIRMTSDPNIFTFKLVDTKTGLADQDYQNIVVDISSGNDAGRLSVQLIENNGMYTL